MNTAVYNLPPDIWQHVKTAVSQYAPQTHAEFGYPALDRVLHTAPVIPFTNHSKLILFSDLHRGNRDQNDPFAANETLYLRAMTHYFKDAFTYIEVGDGDDLWLTPDFEQIRQSYPKVFTLLNQFQRQNRLQMIVGNHEIMVSDHRKQLAKDNFLSREGIVLQQQESWHKVLVVHGHQVDYMCDRMNLITKELTQLVVNGASQLGGFALAETHESSAAGKQLEKILARSSKWYQLILNHSMEKWAQLRQQMVIYGHTHLPTFPHPGGSRSFNIGCGTCPDIITGIEIEAGHISQIAWTMNEAGDSQRHLLAGPFPLQLYFV